MKRPFTKPALTYQQQIELLRRRGMEVENDEQAAFYLRHLNYYRLGAYWLPFEADHSSHRFRPGTSFERVLSLYVFDRELRLLVLDAIERIEVSVRGQWAYQLAHACGPHAHLDPAFALDFRFWQKNYDELKQAVGHFEEVFIRHFREHYSEALPPVWAVCEVMSLGQLSRWYSNLGPMAVRRRIAEVYGIDEAVLQSWLHHLSHLRNTCAHHARLWNREFTITPKYPKNKPRGLVSHFNRSRRLYNSLVILLHCMDTVAPGHHWRGRLVGLLRRHGADTAAMGFPEGWESLPLWRNPDDR